MHSLLAKLRRGFLYALAILVPLVLFYQQFLFQGRVFVSSDHHMYYEPFASFIGEALRSGRLPLWNPYVNLGMPQVALSSIPALYPPDLIFAIVPYSKGLALLQIFHQLVIALGMVLFVLSLGLGWQAALVASVVASLTGYMFSLTPNYSLVGTIAWLPLSLFLARRLSQAETRGERSCFTAFLALATATMVAAGRPEIFVPATAVLAVFSIVSAVRSENRTVLLFLYALSYGSALLLVMPILLPASEWSAVSVRAHGLPISEVTIWSANWYNWLCLLLPTPLGDLQVLGNPFLGMTADRKDYLPILASPYIGAPAILLAIAGAMDRQTRVRYWILAALCLFVILSLGRHTPLVPLLLGLVPLLGAGRYPVKLLVFVIFAIALLAGLGLRAASLTRLSVRAFKVIVVFTAMLLTSGLALVVIGKIWLAEPSSRLTLSAEAFVLIGSSLLIEGALSAITCLLIWIRHKRRLELGPFVVAVTLLIASDLTINAMKFQPLSGPGSFNTEMPFLYPSIKKRDPQLNCRLCCLYKDPVAMPNQLLEGDPAERTLRYYRYCRDIMLPNSNVDFKVFETGGYEVAEPGTYRRLWQDLVNRYRLVTDDGADRDRMLHAFLCAAGSKYVATQRESDNKPYRVLNADFFKLEEEHPSMNLRLYSLKKDVHRLFLAENWSWVKDRETALQLLREKNQSFDPLESPVVEIKSDAIQVSPETDKPISKDADQPHWVVLNHDPEHISVTVRTRKLSLLVLCDQFYPGWRVLVDTMPAPVFCVNGFTRGVFVPEGAHLVEFDYQPQSFANGLNCALLAVSILAVLFLCAIARPLLNFFKWSAGQG